MKHKTMIPTAAAALGILCILLAASEAGAEVTSDYFVATSSSATNSFAGKVGLGTTSPSGKLHIKSDGINTAALKVEDSNSQQLFSLGQGFPWNPNWAYLYSTAGVARVGLTAGGYSSYISGRLAVGTNANLSYGLLIQAADAWPLGVIGTNGTALFQVCDYGSGAGAMRLLNGGTNRCEIKSSGDSYFTGGDVGIGTNNPAYSLHVVGDAKVEGTLTMTEGLNVSAQGDVSMGIYTNDVTNAVTLLTAYGGYPVKLGYINGAWVQWNTTNKITITIGEGYCNGHYFCITSDTSYTMSGLTTNGQFQYVYMDDSASTYPYSLAITNSTTAPAKSGTKQGWYSGEDRCLGVVYSMPGVAALTNFYQMGGRTWVNIGGTLGMLAQAANASTSWTNPPLRDCDAATPTNAKAVLLNCWYGDSTPTPSESVLYVAPKEIVDNGNAPQPYYAAIYCNGTGYDKYGKATAWMELGASRKIKYSTGTGDDNIVYIFVIGWEIDR